MRLMEFGPAERAGTPVFQRVSRDFKELEPQVGGWEVGEEEKRKNAKDGAGWHTQTSGAGRINPG